MSLLYTEPKTPNTPYWIPHGYGVPISDLYGVSTSQYAVLNMAQLSVRAQRHPWLRYEVEGYTKEAESSRTVTSKGDLRGYWEEISSFGDFFTTIPFYLLIRDPLRRLYHCLIAHTIARRGHALEKVTFGREPARDDYSRDGAGQQVTAVDALEVAESAAHAKEEARLEDEVHGIQVSLGEQREVVDVMAGDLS
ncbi:hypothetical protein Tco_1129501, partial [Tanacetum coccineum]